MGGLSAEKRAALYRLRALIWTEAAAVCQDRFGTDLLGPKLEGEVMKIVRLRWGQQSRDIQDGLMQGEEITADMLNPFVDPVDVPESDVPAGHVAAANAAAGESLAEDRHSIRDGKPKIKDKEHGIRVLVARRRSELGPKIKLDQPTLDNKTREDELRKLARIEFNALSIAEQWELVDGQRRSAPPRGQEGGRFVSHEAETPVIDGAGALAAAASASPSAADGEAVAADEALRGGKDKDPRASS